MELILYEGFSKRQNSTKVPEYSSGTVVDVKLKQNTSVENPTFLIYADNLNLEYNYAKWNNHYYYINDIILGNNNIYELSCVQDLLATHKADILDTDAFIAYSSTGYDINLIDNRVATKVTKEINSNSSNMGSLFDATGCYILSVANRHNSGNGMACQYVLSAENLDGFANSLMNPNLYEQIAQYFNGSPMQSIISCTWMPIKFDIAKGNTQAPIEFGGATFDTLYYILKSNTSTVSHEDTIAIPWRYTDFRRNAPYTSMSLLIPFYGLIDINSSDLIGETNIWYRYTVDIGAGDVCLVIRLGSETGKIISTLQFNIGVACPISQTSSNMGGVASGTAGAVAGLGTFAVGVISENALAAIGGLGAIAMSVSSAALSYNTRSTSVKGSINGRSMRNLGFTMILSSYSMDTENPDLLIYVNRQGRPVMKYGKPSNYSGYLQTVNASIGGAMLASDREAINQLLDAGIYLE